MKKNALSYMSIVFLMSLFVFSCQKAQSIVGPSKSPSYENDGSSDSGDGNITDNPSMQPHEKEIWISSVKNKKVYKGPDVYTFLDNGDLSISGLAFTGTCQLNEVRGGENIQAFYCLANNIKDCVKDKYGVTDAPDVVSYYFCGYMVKDGILYEAQASSEYNNLMSTWFNVNGHRNENGDWIPNNNADWATNPYFYRPITMVDFSKMIKIGKLQ